MPVCLQSAIKCYLFIYLFSVSNAGFGGGAYSEHSNQQVRYELRLTIFAFIIAMIVNDVIAYVIIHVIVDLALTVNLCLFCFLLAKVFICLDVLKVSELHGLERWDIKK